MSGLSCLLLRGSRNGAPVADYCFAPRDRLASAGPAPEALTRRRSGPNPTLTNRVTHEITYEHWGT